MKCCDLHGVHCEPPSELCCNQCTEADHPRHPPGARCVLDSGRPEVDSTTVHCYPVNDLVEHDTTGEHDCVCGPDTEHVPNPDGPDGWLITHHSLDARERREQIGKPGGDE